MNNLVFATATWARDLEEKHLIIESVRLINKYNFPIVIAEKINSDIPLIDELRKFSNVIIEYGDNFHEQRKKAFLTAAEIGENIFWIESDKVDFIKNHLLKLIDDFLNKKDKNIVIVPAQDDESFLQYPEFQQVIENCINNLISAILGINGRFSYGPLLFPSRLVSYLEKINNKSDFGWGIGAFLLVAAFKRKIPIKNIFLKINSPPDIQTGEELNQFRIKQFKEYLIAIEEAFKISKN